MSSSSSSSCVSSSVSTGRNPKGLQNHNNTCYMISLLQSLSYLESFTSFLDSFTVRNAGPNCILILVQNLMNELRDPKNRKEVLSPSGIVSNMLSKFPSHFQKGREDSSCLETSRFASKHCHRNFLASKHRYHNFQNCDCAI